MRPAHNSGRGLVGDHRTRPDARSTCGTRTQVYVLVPCRSGLDGGRVVTMTSLAIDPAAALAPFGDVEVIPLSRLGDHLGMTRNARNDLVIKGLIRPTIDPNDHRRARGRRVLVDRDEALLIVAAALLAAALGIAIATVIRGLRNSGVILTADAVTIPLSGLNSLNGSAA